MFTRAVADREDPAVAGHRVAVAVLHVERRLDPRLGVARASPSTCGWPCRRATPGCGTCRGPGRSGCWRRRRRRRSAARTLDGVGAVGGCDHGAAHEAAVDDRLRSPRAPCEQGGPGGDRRSRPPSRRARGGARRSRSCGNTGCAGHCSSSCAAHARWRAARRSGGTGPARRPGPCRASCLHGAGRQAVAAGLLAGERLALDDGDVVAVAGEPVRGRGAGRAAADDEDVVVDAGVLGTGSRQAWASC